MIQVFLADERTDQPKVVQEVLADLKKGDNKFLLLAFILTDKQIDAATHWHDI